MGRFITAKARIEQTDIAGYWKTIDNELYLDDDGSLYLVPRYFWSDGYTFPGIIMAFLGDHHKYDVRPAHGHDLSCRFHECIKVEMSLTLLKARGYLRIHKGKVILEDIPVEYLNIVPVSKHWTDEYFERMMHAAELPQDKRNIIRAGVFFNLNWWLKTGKKSLLEYELYKDDLGLVNGV
jgi:hypothetical protein